MTTRNNPDAPPWAKKAVARLRAAGVVEDKWLPLDDGDILGCGHYGCVYALPDPTTVLKISSDPTEVHFIKRAMAIGDWPEGIVKYRALTELDFTYRRRRVYAIWREAAFEVGLSRSIYFRRIYGITSSDWDQQLLARFAKRLDQFRTAAAIFRDRLQRAEKRGARKKFLAEVKALENWAYKWVAGPEDLKKMWYRGARAAAFALRVCEVVAELMEHEQRSVYVGQALSFYLERGLLLADVHGQNVGRVERTDWDWDPNEYVITDPGHAVDLVK